MLFVVGIGGGRLVGDSRTLAARMLPKAQCLDQQGVWRALNELKATILLEQDHGILGAEASSKLDQYECLIRQLLLVSVGSCDVLYWCRGRMSQVQHKSAAMSVLRKAAIEQGDSLKVCINLGTYRNYLALVAEFQKVGRPELLGWLICPTPANIFNQVEIRDGQGEMLAELRRSSKKHSILESWGVWLLAVAALVSPWIQDDVQPTLVGAIALIYASNLKEETINFAALVTSCIHNVDARQMWAVSNLNADLSMYYTAWTIALTLPSFFTGPLSTSTSVMMMLVTLGSLPLASGCRDAMHLPRKEMPSDIGRFWRPTLRHAVYSAWKTPLATPRQAIGSSIRRRVCKQRRTLVTGVECLLLGTLWSALVLVETVLISAVYPPVLLVAAACLLLGETSYARGGDRLAWPVGRKPVWGENFFKEGGCHWGKGLCIPCAYVLTVAWVDAPPDGGEPLSSVQSEPSAPKKHTRTISKLQGALQVATSAAALGELCFGRGQVSKLEIFGTTQHVREERLRLIGGVVVPQHIGSMYETSGVSAVGLSLAGVRDR